MLPKLERLKERHLFNLTINLGKKNKQRLFSSYLILYYLKRKDKKDINYLPKAAFVVGLSVDKRATIRNLIKRRLRAAYRQIREKLITKGINNLSTLVWIATPSVKNPTFSELKDTMEDMLCKLQKQEKINLK